MRLGDMLVQAGVITAPQLEHALSLQRQHGGKLGEVLVSSGLLSEDLLMRALSRQLELPMVDLAAVHDVIPALRERVPFHVSERLRLVPLAYVAERNAVQVAMVDPFDVVALDELRSMLGTRLEPYLTGASALATARLRLYGMGNAVGPLPSMPSLPSMPAPPVTQSAPLLLLDDTADGAAEEAAAAAPASFHERLEEQVRFVNAVADILIERGIVQAQQLPRR